MLPTGTGTAIVTPFGPDGTVDHRALAALAIWQVDEGIDFLVACGSTGEAATLDATERMTVVTTVVEAADGHVSPCWRVRRTTTRRVRSGGPSTIATLGVARAS